MPTTKLNRRSVGFSVIELMVAIAVLAIILGIGMPSLQAVLEKSRLDSAAEAMADSFRYARSEAIARNETIEVDGTYQNGWAVKVDASGETLRVYDAFPASVETTNNSTVVEFNGRGMLRDSSAKTFELDYDDGIYRCIRVLLSGAVKLTEGGC